MTDSTDTSKQDLAPEPSHGSAEPPHSSRRPFLLVGALGLLGLIVAVAAFAGDGGSNGELSLADSEFTLVDGEIGTLSDFHGDPLVVNFFASWCAPCRAEIPDFEEASQDLAGEVDFLGVNTDFTEASWKSFVAETDLSYPTVFQPSNELFAAVEAKGMPTTVFFSADGDLIHTHSGLLTKDALMSLIDTHIRS